MARAPSVPGPQLAHPPPVLGTGAVPIDVQQQATDKAMDDGVVYGPFVRVVVSEAAFIPEDTSSDEEEDTAEANQWLLPGGRQT